MALNFIKAGDIGSTYINITAGFNSIVHLPPNLTSSRWIRSVKQRGEWHDAYGVKISLNGATYYFDTPELVVIGKNGRVVYYIDTTCDGEAEYAEPHYAAKR